jgi:hypothetical protein
MSVTLVASFVRAWLHMELASFRVRKAHVHGAIRPALFDVADTDLAFTTAAGVQGVEVYGSAR